MIMREPLLNSDNNNLKKVEIFDWKFLKTEKVSNILWSGGIC